MSAPTKSVLVEGAYDLEYPKLREIADNCGGWIRSSGGPEGDEAKVWHDDTEYRFQGRGLIAFLYAVKDKNVDSLYAAIDLCEYIEKAAKQPPSVFVRDAIVNRSRELKAKIQGAEAST